MTCDIFIKSYAADFEFLGFCLRSIQRFATGFRQIVVVVPKDDMPPTGTAEVVYKVKEFGEPYLFQQSVKLHADHFTDAEFILFMDSDTVFTRPVCPADFITDNRRVKWLYTPYSSLGNDESQMWKPVTEKILGFPVENETMRRHPLIAPRWALQSFRESVHRVHGVTLEQYIMSQPNKDFSEWNALGNWLFLHRHDRIDWINTDKDMGTVFTHQSWSHGGINPDLRKHLEAALA